MGNLINKKIKEFKVQAYYNKEFVEITDDDVRGKWSVFFAIVLGFYFICLAIYGSYRQKKSESYTLALQKYQQERRVVNV